MLPVKDFGMYIKIINFLNFIIKLFTNELMNQ